jgi:hypothetical protein
MQAECRALHRVLNCQRKALAGLYFYQTSEKGESQMSGKRPEGLPN